MNFSRPAFTCGATVTAPVITMFTSPATAAVVAGRTLLTSSGERLEDRELQWFLRDLDEAIGLDGDGDGQLTWDEVRARHAAIAAYALSRLQVSSEAGTCAIEPGHQLVVGQVVAGACRQDRLEGLLGVERVEQRVGTDRRHLVRRFVARRQDREDDARWRSRSRPGIRCRRFPDRWPEASRRRRSTT